MNSINPIWCKSSHSKPQGECVELTTTLDQLRDSKDPDGPTLKADVSAFVRAIKDGRFDH